MTNSKYTTTLLRERLGETLDSLLDKENPLDLDRAKAVADIAQVMINVAKVEIDYMRVSGGEGTGFIVEQTGDVKLPSASPADQLTSGRRQLHSADKEESESVNDYLSGGKSSFGNVTVHKGGRY